MNAFYFGASARPLFGVYLPANPARDRDAGVVLCYPHGWEYLRGHRAFRQLAVRLSEAGFHVLRFDYFGTGDSAGEPWEGTPDQWLEDAATAVDELRDTAGVRAVSLVGMRLGAVLAARLAASRRDIDRLVLWDPVIRGADHLGRLADAHPRLGGAGELATGLAAASGAIDAEGFPLSAVACQQVEAIDLLQSSVPRVRSALLVTTEADPGIDELAGAFKAAGIAATARHVAARTDAPASDDFVNTVMPTEVLDAVVDYFLETPK